MNNQADNFTEKMRTIVIGIGQTGEELIPGLRATPQTINYQVNPFPQLEAYPYGPNIKDKVGDQAMFFLVGAIKGDVGAESAQSFTLNCFSASQLYHRFPDCPQPAPDKPEELKAESSNLNGNAQYPLLGLRFCRLKTSLEPRLYFHAYLQTIRQPF